MSGQFCIFGMFYKQTYFSYCHTYLRHEVDLNRKLNRAGSSHQPKRYEQEEGSSSEEEEERREKEEKIDNSDEEPGVKSLETHS